MAQTKAETFKNCWPRIHKCKWKNSSPKAAGAGLQL